MKKFFFYSLILGFWASFLIESRAAAASGGMLMQSVQGEKKNREKFGHKGNGQELMAENVSDSMGVSQKDVETKVADKSVGDNVVVSDSVDIVPSAPKDSSKQADSSLQDIEITVVDKSSESVVSPDLVAGSGLASVDVSKLSTVPQGIDVVEDEESLLASEMGEPLVNEAAASIDVVDSTVKKESEEALEEKVSAVGGAKGSAEIATDKKVEEDGQVPEAPVEPTAEEVKKRAAEREKVELELTPPACLPSELDTTALDAGGNWVIKRAFWELAEKAYEKIMQVNNELYDLQVKFIQAQNENDKQSDIAFRELGFEQGKVAELLDAVIGDLAAQQEAQSGLDQPERELLKTLKDKREKLEQLKLDLIAIDELEDTIGKVMDNLMQQVGACRKYEKQSWEHFKAIGKELNDKKARLMFYEMEGFLKTVEKNRDYVAQDLWNFLGESSRQVKEYFSKVKSSVSELQQKGTDIVKEFERIEKANQEVDEKSLEAEKEQIKKEMEELALQKKALSEQGFLNKTWKSIKSLVNEVYSAFANRINSVMTSVKNMLGLK